MSDAYLLKRGYLGALRLGVLAEAAGPGTSSLLDRLPWQPGWKCLDVGCGLGFVARELARRGGRVMGVDSSPDFLEAARARGGVEYRTGDACNLGPLDGPYDLVCARYLLSHLPEPGRVVSGLSQLLKPGGFLVLEDVDFPGHLHHPPCAAFQRYLELYQECASRRGGDARLGRKLAQLAGEAGLSLLYLGMSQPLQHGAERRVAELTLSHIGGALQEFQLCGRSELAALLRELRAWRGQAGLVSLAPTVQVVAQKSP